jgi:hypothetical protein
MGSSPIPGRMFERNAAGNERWSDMEIGKDTEPVSVATSVVAGFEVSVGGRF